MSTDSDYFLYSNAHYWDMCMCVFKCDDEIPAGRLKYQEKFPNRPLPPEKVFETILLRLKTTGSFHAPLSEPSRLRSGRIRIVQEPYNDETPTTSADNGVTRTSSADNGVTRTSSADNGVTSTDGVDQYEPNPTNVQRRTPRRSRKRAKKIQKPYFKMGSKQLLPSDYGPRVEFCQWYLDRVKENPEFTQRILWSGMATITRDSIINEEYWSFVKLKGKAPSWHINVWAGIIGTKLIGPIFLPKDEKQNYLATILTTLQDALAELPVTELKDIVFQHSLIPPSFNYNWKNCLDECFPVWIGEGGPIAWPDCSMDLTPVHYFLWGHLKTYMFEKTCKSEAELRQKIISTFETIRNTPGLIARAIKSVHRNATLCIERKGGDFSYILKGWPALQIQLLQELVVAARRMGHPALATRHMTFLLQTMWPHLSRQEHRELAIQLQALSAQCEGGPVPLVLETGEVIPPANLTHVPHCSWFNTRPLPPARAPHLRQAKPAHGPFIFTPIHFGSLERNAKKDEGKMEYLWVEDDICEVQMKLTNPLPFELKVSNMRLLTSGVVFESIPETIILPPDSPTTVNLHGTPKEVGELQIQGYSTHTLGVKSNCRLKNMPAPHKFPASYTIEVIPSLPTITIETIVAPSGNASATSMENVGSTTNISLFNGESTDCSINITNTSNVPIEHLELAIQSNMDSQLQSKVFQYSNEDIQSLLPIPPNETATIAIKLYGEADFLDLGGVGVENLFPLSLNSNYPSRVGSPVPNAQTSLPTQSSNPQTSLSSGLIPNRTSGSFRSTNSHTTSWSAPISVMSPSRGRQVEAQLMIRYSGGEGKDIHCRQSTLQINLELLPSVSITHWDVLPAEIPSQLYLVLDVTNLTSEEMDFHYAPSKHILIESKESCRVPVPLDRCPFNTTPSKPVDEDLVESKSTNTGTSTNSLELMCSEHITNNISLRWHLMQSDITGRASVKGITLSQAMMDIVRMSPLNWEVSVNSQCIKPQEEYNCSAGECLSLGVAVWNHLCRPLHKLCLSVQFYQDYNNGVLSYKLDNRVATAGNNKVVLSTLPESAKAYHECTVVFLTPGEYKIDIQCSTTEPILDEVSLIKETEHPSIIQPCAGEVSHIWRFIPPVAISVTD